ncbi:hypothetical protein AB9P05_04590 [Roseivirga sp. BDSF3-8]|uniref:DUF7738 domain-containing protein n=1 Tax=Roseivirga sp. BDSF3-8 TaxID=3241598 RepID=UPI003531A4D0
MKKSTMRMIMSLLVTLIVTCTASYGQSDMKITYTPEEGVVLKSTNPLEGMDTTQLVALLGAPTQARDFISGEKSFYYDEAGLVFMTTGGQVQGVGITFNHDGDDKFSATPFTGQLHLGDISVDRETTPEDLTGSGKVEIICPIPIMCASKDRTAPVKVMAGYSEEGALTQMILLFPQEG